METPSSETESPNCEQPMQNRSLLSNSQFPAMSKHSVHRVDEGMGASAEEIKALQTELNTSQCPSLGSQTSGHTDHTTADASPEAFSSIAKGTESSLPTDTAVKETAIDRKEDESVHESMLVAKVVATAKSEDSTTSKGIPLSIKTLRKEETNEGQVNIFDVTSPMTPGSFGMSDASNNSPESELAATYGNSMRPLAREDIAGLSPILATRESDIACGDLPSPASHVDRGDTEFFAQGAVLHSASPSAGESFNHSCLGEGSEHSGERRSVLASDSVDNSDTITGPPESVAPEDGHATSTEKSKEEPSAEMSSTSIEYDEDHVSAWSTRVETDIPSTEDDHATSAEKIEEGPSAEMSITSTEYDEDHVSERRISAAADIVSKVGPTVSSTEENKRDITKPMSETEIDQIVQQPNPTSSIANLSSINDQEVDSTTPEGISSANQVSDGTQPLISDASGTNEKGAIEHESSSTYRDLTSAKKHVDASSLAFIERLRGAAHRRKLQVARSRDSLAAKERIQLLTIATAKERQLTVVPSASTMLAESRPSQGGSDTVDPYRPFKARPVPSTTGHIGSGGQIGIPKVEKKPTTTPFSPLLGSRRPQKEEIRALDPVRNKASRPSLSRSVEPDQKSLNRNQSQGQTVSFKARPVPSTTGIQGHGGQAGVPKIAKRPVTVPSSPCLGKRRSSLAGTHKNPGKPIQPAKWLPSEKKETVRAQPFRKLLSVSEVRSGMEGESVLATLTL